MSTPEIVSIILVGTPVLLIVASLLAVFIQTFRGEEFPMLAGACLWFHAWALSSIGAIMALGFAIGTAVSILTALFGCAMLNAWLDHVD